MYNYYSAFLETTPIFNVEQLREIGVAAMIVYSNEFPDLPHVDIDYLMETKHVEVTGGPEPRLYSWRQLGFII